MVTVPMMQVGIVRMAVAQRIVAMPVRMRFTRWVIRQVRMSMVSVVVVTMLMLDRFVEVVVCMSLR